MLSWIGLANHDFVENGEESVDNWLHIDIDCERSNEGQHQYVYTEES